MAYGLFLLPLLGLGYSGCGPANRTEPNRKSERTNDSDLPPVPSRVNIAYHVEPVNDSGEKMLRRRFSLEQQNTILAVNRIDKAHLRRLDSLIIPDTLVADRLQYSPFPFDVPALRPVQKVIFFSYPAQAFGAYERGRLVRWGPTSMGRRDAQTPNGLFYTNWKAEETQSTVDDEWILRWNFNIENKEGIGWHQYAMPGYPASHSCLRLVESDAQYLYFWAEQWILEGTDSVLAKGTPTFVFGKYNFDAPVPWLALAKDKNALDIKPEDLERLARPHLNEILNNQRNLDSMQQVRQQQKIK